ncbi:MAG: TIM barrel protein [Kiritimatiellales bacterium]
MSELFKWGVKQGFNWVEVRDFELNFSETELLTIKTAAKRCGLRVHYAWDTTSVYKIEDRERILKGICNAALFGSGTCSRIVIAPELMNPAAGKSGYSVAEFQVLTKNIREYVQYANERGVTLVFENSLEPIDTFEALLENLPDMRMTFDTANTFNEANTGATLSWPQLKAFTARRKEQIPYVHLKSFKDGVTQSELLPDGKVPLKELMSLLDPTAWLCVGLPSNDQLSSGLERVANGLRLVKSLECFTKNSSRSPSVSP